MASGSVAGFLMEAWEGLLGLEEAVSGLDAVRDADGRSTRESEAPREALVGLAHRLERAASNHGFLRLARLAESLGRLARHLPPREHPSFEDTRQLLGETLTVLPMVYENLAAEGREDIPQIDGLQWRFDTEARAAEALASERAAAEAPGAVDRDLDRFREDDPEALAFFAPEAAEHLDGMAAALETLRVGEGTGGGDAATLHDLFRHAHTLKGAAFTVGCESVGHLAHAVEDALAPSRRSERPPRADVLDASFAGLELLRAMIGRLVGSVHERGPGLQTRYDEVMLRLGDLRGATPAATRSTVPASSALFFDDEEPTSISDAYDPRGASAEAETETRESEAGELEATDRIVPVGLDRLDALFDLAAEAALLRGRVAGRLDRLRDVGREVEAGRERLVLSLDASLDDADDDAPSLLDGRASELAEDLREIGTELGDALDTFDRDLERLRVLAARLRTGLGRMRQMPVGSLFERLERAALRAAANVGTRIDVERVGDAVEVDEAVLERVAEALGHLVRNAVHHGLESEDERLDAGKPRRGRLTLAARARGRAVRLIVADDGRGLDPESLRRRAVELGLADAEEAARLDDAAAQELIYRPGLTTAERVTTGAGRGVGMDAVRHAVGRLGGELRLESAPREGTRFVLDLPTSLRVTEALRLRVGDSVFGLPLAGVRRLVHVRRDQLASPAEGPEAADGHRLRVDGTEMPLVPVADRLGLTASGPAEPLPGLLGTAVVVAPTGRPAALLVDDVLGIDEVVIRSLGDFLGAVEPFAGATLDAEGRVMLLVDALSLLENRGESLTVPPPPPRPSVRRATNVDDSRSESSPVARVLLVDDSPSVRRVLGRDLRSAGFEVVDAADGVEASERLLAGGVDALVTDLEMPRRGGAALIRDLRRRDNGRHLPVVVLSTRAERDRLDTLGVDAWFPKPVEKEALITRLRSLVGRALVGEEART